MSGSARWLAPATTGAALLAWSLLVVPALPAGTAARAGFNLVALAALLALTSRSGLGRRGTVHRPGPGRGLTPDELGLGRRRWASGAAWGALALGATAAFWGSALALPVGRVALSTADGSGEPLPAVLVRALVLIPVGTVLCEELAFRGVLLAQLRRVAPDGRALLASSAVFALWHLGPAVSSLGSGDGPSALAVAGTLVATGAGGLAFGWLRLRSGSLLAPVGLHLGTNALGLLAAALAVRVGP